MRARGLAPFLLLPLACGGGDGGASAGAAGFGAEAGTAGSSSGAAGSSSGKAGAAGSSTAGSATAGSSTAGSSTAGSSTAGSSTAGSSGAATSGAAGSATAGSSAAGSSSAGAAGSGTAGGPPGPGRGFPDTTTWVSFYGEAKDVDLAKIAATFRIINIEADPAVGAVSKADVTTLKAGGKNRVISYLNVGSCEEWRDYWDTAPAGFVACGKNTSAELGLYDGYPDEHWMNPSSDAHQHLMVDFVAQRLVDQGVDGFFLDNLEILSHGTGTSNGPCDAACSQGGLDLVRRLREKFPNHLIVMQNGTSDVTRLGTTGGLAYPSLLDGVTHEEVYEPAYDKEAETEMSAWKAMGLTPGGRPFFLGTEDYVGSCGATAKAMAAYQKSKAKGFTPYASDASASMQGVCFWPF